MIIKGTSIISVIGIAELVRAGEHATQRHPRELMPAFLQLGKGRLAYGFPGEVVFTKHHTICKRGRL